MRVPLQHALAAASSFQEIISMVDELRSPLMILKLKFPDSLRATHINHSMAGMIQAAMELKL